MTNPYLEPVSSPWLRAVGIVLLLAGAALATYLVRELSTWSVDAAARRHLTSSSVIFALARLALAGICLQAGYRLAFNRPGANGSLFSPTGWCAIGTGLVSMAGLMGYAIVTVRPVTATDAYVIVGLAVSGLWCFVLAFRSPTPGRCSRWPGRARH